MRLASGLLLLLAALSVPADDARRSFRLPSVSLRQPILWGYTAEAADGTALAFGGQDQTAADGRGRTRLRLDGRWQALYPTLRQANPLQRYHDRVRALRETWKDSLAAGRRLYLRGHPAEETRRQARESLLPALRQTLSAVVALANELDRLPDLPAYEAGQVRVSLALLHQAVKDGRSLTERAEVAVDPTLPGGLRAAQVLLEKAAEPLDAEPPPRALSPIVHEPRSGLFVLFGGDHLDYLTADTWIFNPAGRRWQQRHPVAAPPPRANHKLRANGDGTITLTGGYTYTSSTDYMGGQYADVGDGEWTYDLAKNTWTGKGKAGASDARAYRTGPFLPEFFLAGPAPDAAAVQKRLTSLPANTWVTMAPPQLPQLNRDWGTAVLDPDRDLILRWSGGHCAHGGTDVLHYHLGSNRWELSAPVEFPLGQLYVNTEYPEGVNFNLRPWVTGHTYQNYGYDLGSRKMLFAGRQAHTYVYDPDRADWAGRFAKPAGMTYNDCFYTLTCTSTPRGLVCWTGDGRLFRHEAARREWVELKLNGRLPGAVVDNSTVVYDSRRDRLLVARKPYGDRARFDGVLHAVDLKTLAVNKLQPKGREAATAISYLCQIRYDVESDLFLVGATLPAGADGRRRTPAYDPAGDRWVSLAVGGTDPSGKAGRNVSLGLMYDAKRRLFWAVDARSQVFALRLDLKAAEPRDLGE